MQFIHISIILKFIFQLIYTKNIKKCIFSGPYREYFFKFIEVSHVLYFSRTREYFLNCILHFGVDENNKKKRSQTRLARSYQLFLLQSSRYLCERNHGPILKFYPLDMVSANKREIERERNVIVRRVCNKPWQFAQSVAMSKSIAMISDQA